MITIGIDELDPDPGERCTCCNEVITGTKYSVYTQVGDPDQAKYAAHLCEGCKIQKLGTSDQ